jgi:3-dehydroquinate synthase
MNGNGGSVSTLRVDLGDRGYDIHMGEGVLESAGQRMLPLLAQDRVIIVSDENVAPLYLGTLEQSLDQAGVEHASVILPAGEGTKSFDGLRKLTDALLNARVERGTTLVALGGGVIGDIAGFAAAITLRGLDFVQIPTTLLAQVDSSVGGKTGINTDHGKNLIGAFHQPRLVLADISVLESLPPRELLAGYGEVVKHALISDAEFFDWLEIEGAGLIAGDPALRRHAVLACLSIKAAIVAEDEREAGRRALLNLGHTFGHALEAETGYGPRLLHGEAVAIGLCLAFDLSARLGLCDADCPVRVRRHLEAVGLPADLHKLASPSWSAEALVAHMGHDKKARDGRLTFVLARGIGQAFITRDVNEGDVLALLNDALAVLTDTKRT